MEEIEKMFVGIIQKDYNTVNELDLDFDKEEYLIVDSLHFHIPHKIKKLTNSQK